MTKNINQQTITTQLTALEPGMQLIYGGNKLYTVTETLANQFKAGDKIMFIENHDEPIIIPEFAITLVDEKIKKSQTAFFQLAQISDEQLNVFYDTFSDNLSNDTIWDIIKEINNKDIEKAKQNGKSTTRLIASNKTRQNMIEGLQEFKDQPIQRTECMNSKLHEGWSVDLMKSPLGVIGFVFEGRPNVIADASGVLKSGNTAIFRVGQDARFTALAILDHALYPALDKANIPRDVIQILNRSERSTAWALFSNPNLNLAVARGSGAAVHMLGNIAQQAGIPSSLHGTGGAWIMTSETTEKERLKDAILGSLDRKVCNTLNTLCILKSQTTKFLPLIFNALEEAGKTLNQHYRVHVESESAAYIDQNKFNHIVPVTRPDGIKNEPQFDIIEKNKLGTEWLWENTPEISLVIVNNLEEAISLYNTYSPQFVASLITQNQIELMNFFNQVNAPFIGNGMTRWVDGQYALQSPELGLSNWENGRFLARSAILSGDSVYTTRIKMNQVISNLSR